MSNILWLSEIDDSDVNSVGNKALSISKLYQSRFLVPPAFCITKEAFKYFLENTGADSDSSIINSELPNGLKKEIEEAYENINVDPGIQGVNKSTFSLIKAGRDAASVVVRVSGDKSLDKSAVLNVKGTKNLVNSIKKAWSIAYSRNEIPALIIQKMVNPGVSGLISFDEDIVLKSVHGFLDSGNLQYADSYRLDKDSLAVKKRDKKMQEYKIVKDDMVNTITSKKVFSSDFKMGESELRMAGNIGKDLVESYNDKEIEFAIDGSKIYLLGVKDKIERDEEIEKDDLPDLITPIPDSLLFNEIKNLEPELKENNLEFVELKLGDIHIKIPKNKKSVEAAYRLLDAISSQLE